MPRLRWIGAPTCEGSWWCTGQGWQERGIEPFVRLVMDVPAAAALGLWWAGPLLPPEQPPCVASQTAQEEPAPDLGSRPCHCPNDSPCPEACYQAHLRRPVEEQP